MPAPGPAIAARNPPERAIPPAMWALALFFFVKAAALALFVTPLWDVPDEVAHFATISDLASGRGVPIPGKAVVPRELVRLWNRGLAGEPVANWVAVHPPGYHLLAVPVLWAARAATRDVEWQVRATRLLSALCGAVGLLVFFRVMREAGADRAGSLAGAAAVGFVPMYSHMSSGVSHDVLCGVLGGLAALAFLRLTRSRQTTDALLLALTLAAAGAVKATAVPVALALLPLVPVHLEGRWPGRVARTAALLAAALSTTWAWALWQGRLPGSAMPAPPGPARPASVLAMLGVLRDRPILDHTFKNFFGLIGWTGTGKGEVAWLQISGPFLAVYLLLAFLVLLLAAAWVWRRDSDRSTPRSAAVAVSWGIAVSTFLAVLAWFSPRPAAWPKLPVYALGLAVPCLAILRVWRRATAPESAVFPSQFAVLVFTAVYLLYALRYSAAAGAIRGTHGRYFFIVIAFLLCGLVFPAIDRLTGGRPRDRLLLFAVLALFANEATFFLSRVLPFYRGGAAAPLP